MCPGTDFFFITPATLLVITLLLAPQQIPKGHSFCFSWTLHFHTGMGEVTHNMYLKITLAVM